MHTHTGNTEILKHIFIIKYDLVSGEWIKKYEVKNKFKCAHMDRDRGRRHELRRCEPIANNFRFPFDRTDAQQRAPAITISRPMCMDSIYIYILFASMLYGAVDVWSMFTVNIQTQCCKLSFMYYIHVYAPSTSWTYSIADIRLVAGE